jgi:recombination protein RecA
MPTTTTIRPESTHQPARDRDLEAALATVAQQFGPSIVTSPNGAAATPPAVIPTGSLALDHALGVGGLPKGRITEVYGPEGVGKTTLSLSVLAQAQRSGGTSMFIDTEHALDLAWAVTAGVDPHRLLLCRPESGEQALQVASVLVDSGAIDALVIDSIAALVPQAELDAQIGEQHAGVQANLLSQALRKLAGPIARAQVAVVVTNQLRQRAGTSVTKQDGVVGSRVRVQVVKNKLAQPWRACELELHADHGLSAEASLLDLGLDAGLLTQHGAWVSYGSLQLGRGRQAACRHLRDHPGLAARLEGELRHRLFTTTQPAVEPAAS